MFAALLCVACAACGQAQQPPKDDLAPTVSQLVRQLDAPEKARRDDAEQQLLELGQEVLEFLPETNERTPAEVALRLERVRSQLERARAEGSVEASTVTLSGQDRLLSAVLAEIARQTGNKLVDFREEFNQETPDPKLDVAFDKTPFWPALDQVLDQAGLAVYNYGEADGIAVVSRSESQLPRHGRATYAGSFRIEATEFTARRDLRDPGSHTLQLVLETSWEPRLEPIVVMHLPDGVQATDENGQPIQVASAGNELEFEVNTDVDSIDLPIHFVLPERNVQRIASLKGKLAALLPGRMETFRFEGLEKAKKVEQRRAGVTVILDGVRKNNEVWEVRVRIAFEKASGALESHRDWIYNNEAYLENPQGEKVLFGTLETTRRTESEVGVAYLFDIPRGPKGHVFVYKTPAAIVSVPVEYELKDLALP